MIGVSAEERAEIEAFIFREARLADESDYAAWEALVTEDMHYWVPFGPANYEPTVRGIVPRSRVFWMTTQPQLAVQKGQQNEPARQLQHDRRRRTGRPGLEASRSVLRSACAPNIATAGRRGR